MYYGGSLVKGSSILSQSQRKTSFHLAGLFATKRATKSGTSSPIMKSREMDSHQGRQLRGETYRRFTESFGLGQAPSRFDESTLTDRLLLLFTNRYGLYPRWRRPLHVDLSLATACFRASPTGDSRSDITVRWFLYLSLLP